MRAFVFTSRGERPNPSIPPAVGYKSPSNILIVVDLPEPFGPSKPNTSPRRTSKSTPSTARALGRPQKSLKTLVSPRTAMMVSADCRGSPLECGVDSIFVMQIIPPSKSCETPRPIHFCSNAFRQYRSMHYKQIHCRREHPHHFSSEKRSPLQSPSFYSHR